MALASGYLTIALIAVVLFAAFCFLAFRRSSIPRAATPAPLVDDAVIPTEETPETLTPLSRETFSEALERAVAACVHRGENDAAALARELRISDAQLRRRLRILTGKQPHEVILHYRLEKAAEMLRTGQSTVREVSESVGYSNPAVFVEHFRAYFGMLPSQYGEGLSRLKAGTDGKQPGREAEPG